MIFAPLVLKFPNGEVMHRWPDKDESLLQQYVDEQKLSEPSASYRWLLRQFQRFVCQRSRNDALTERVLRAWVQERGRKSPESFVIRHAQFVKAFLDWLVKRGDIPDHPFAELQRKYECRSIRAITRALISSTPDTALERLRPVPRYGSHLGKCLREHVERMRTLGYRYRNESRFLHFDRFLQQRPKAAQESLGTLVGEYAAAAPSADSKLRRLILGRIVARALNRQGSSIVVPVIDRLWVRETLRNRRQPYIYSVEEVCRLLETARCHPSPRAPFRPITLYTMLILAYCAGLRLGEIVHLTLADVDMGSAAIEIRNTKFFKSRRLPLSSSAMKSLRDYLEARQQAGAPSAPNAPLFWHSGGGYSYHTAGALLRLVIRRAGLYARTSRRGTSIHDLRHSFVVHRMTAWYQAGVDCQSRLPYLAAYLGHRDIHSTLVYLTITKELLALANQRFHNAQADVLRAIRGEL